jgi:hypothetical protein
MPPSDAAAVGVDVVAEGAHQVRLAAAGHAEQQQDAAARRPVGGAGQQALERVARFLVDRLDVERVGAPDFLVADDRAKHLGAGRRAKRLHAPPGRGRFGQGGGHGSSLSTRMK